MAILIGQPVNKRHPLNRGLSLWLMRLPGLGGGLNWFDLCKRNNATLTSGCSWSSTKFGFVSVNNGASTDHVNVSAPSGLNGATSATIGILAKTGGGGTGRLVDTGGGTDDYWPYFGNGLLYSGAFRNARVDGMTVGVTMTDWHWDYITTDGTNWVLYQRQVGGALVTVNTVAAQATVTAGSTISFGTDASGSGTAWNGNWGGVRLWVGRALSAADVVQDTNEWAAGFPTAMNYTLGGFVSTPPAAGSFKSAWARNSNIILQPGALV